MFTPINTVKQCPFVRGQTAISYVTKGYCWEAWNIQNGLIVIVGCDAIENLILQLAQQ